MQRPYLVVTMEDLWEQFQDEFDEDCIVHFVKTLEYQEIMEEVERLPKFEAVIGLGGGQAVDYAKMAAWKSHMPQTRENARRNGPMTRRWWMR